MNVDRRIDLNVSVPDFDSRSFDPGSSQGGNATRQPPDGQTQDRFERLLAGTDTDKLPDVDAEKVSAPNPFSVLVGLPVADLPRPVRQQAADLSHQIGSSIERLMVDDGHNGQHQVRMELKDELLPGVTVVIQELDGRLQVDFICSVESSRLRLNEAAPEQARSLAESLRRDVLLRVQTDDDEDPCLLETLACS
jgi:hypothetical protein